MNALAGLTVALVVLLLLGGIAERDEIELDAAQQRHAARCEIGRELNFNQGETEWQP